VNGDDPDGLARWADFPFRRTPAVWGIDPGRKDIVCAVRFDDTKDNPQVITISSTEYRNLAGMEQTARRQAR
jgi:hypothetical protein